MRERLLQLDQKLCESLGHDRVARIAARCLLKAIEALRQRREIELSQSDVCHAGWQIPAERVEELSGTVWCAGHGADNLEQVCDVVRDAIDRAGHGRYVVAALSESAGPEIGASETALGAGEGDV